jgi:hypothetical protein
VSAREPFRMYSFWLPVALGPCVPTFAVGWQLGPSLGRRPGRCIGRSEVRWSRVVRGLAVVRGPRDRLAELVVVRLGCERLAVRCSVPLPLQQRRVPTGGVSSGPACVERGPVR